MNVPLRKVVQSAWVRSDRAWCINTSKIMPSRSGKVLTLKSDGIQTRQMWRCHVHPIGIPQWLHYITPVKMEDDHPQFLENQPRNLTRALKNHPKLSRKPPTNSQVAGRHWPKLAEPASCTREGLSQTSCWHTKSHEPSPKTRGWSCNRSLVIGHGLLENPIGVSVATFDDTWGYMFIQLPYKYLQTLALLLTNHGETMCATL